MKKKLTACVSALAAVAAAVIPLGVASPGGAAAKAPVVILDITATSGATAIYGSQETLGLEAGAKYVNSTGGILGHKVIIKIVNDNSDPATAVSELSQDLANGASKYTMVWAGEEGTATAALLPILKRYPGVYATAVNDGNGQCTQVSNCPGFFAQEGGVQFAEIADANYLKSLGVKSVGIVEEQFTYDEAENTYILQDLAKMGIKTTVQTIETTAVSATPEMQALQSAGVQAVFAETLGPTAAYVLSARAALNWNVPMTLDITGSSVNDAGLVPVSQLQGVTETAQYCMVRSNKDPSFPMMIKWARPQAFNGSIICAVPYTGWNAIQMLKAAATQANSVNDAALIKTTAHLHFASTQKNYAFWMAGPATCWTTTNHENACQRASYDSVVPAGLLKNTRLYPLPKS